MDWVIVEVVVGLAFLFFVISFVSSAIQEAIAGLFKLRARTLEKGVVNLLTGSSQSLRQALKEPGNAPSSGPPTDATSPTDTGGTASAPDAESSLASVDGLLRNFFSHSLISSYRQGDDMNAGDFKPKLPSYLASRSFRNAMLDVTGLLEATGSGGTNAQVEEIIGSLPSKHLQNTFRTLWVSVDKDLNEFRQAVERWYDRAMERVSGWYKRRAQLFLFIIGLLVAVAVNADAIRTADVLWKDDGLRSGLVNQLGTQNPNPAADTVLDKLSDLGFPIGWGGDKTPSGSEIPVAIIGWLITGIAVTFGASFWFDFLGKVSNLRSAGRAPQSTVEPGPAGDAAKKT